MPIQYINSDEFIIAAGHPNFDDTKNRCGQYIHNQMLVEHDANGRHLDRAYALVGEFDSFTGTGAAKTVTLTNTNLTPLIVECWEHGTPGEMVTNGGFDSDTSSWTATAGTIASVAGGQSGNCCQVTQGTTELVVNGGFETDLTGWTYSTGTGGSISGGVSGGQSGNCCSWTSGSAGVVTLDQIIPTPITGPLYKINFYLQSSNSANVASYANGSYVNHTPPASWGAFSRDVYLSSSGFGFYDGITGRTMYVDSVSCYDVPYFYQDLTTIIGRTYNLSIAVKSGTSGDQFFLVYAGSNQIIYSTTTGSWVTHTAQFVATATTTRIKIYKGSNTAGTMLFDTVSVTETDAPYYTRFSLFPSGYSCRRNSTALVTNGIGTSAIGQFTIPAGSKLNTDGIDNYYSVLGVDLTTSATGDTGAGSDPTWIISDVTKTMYGDGVGGGAANSVEKHIEDAFLHEHNDDGTHPTDRFAGLAMIEVYSYIGDGTADRTVTLQDANLDVKEVHLFYVAGSSVVISATEGMPDDKAKLEGTAAYAGNYIVSTGTGSFVVDASANVSGRTYYYYAIGLKA